MLTLAIITWMLLLYKLMDVIYKDTWKICYNDDIERCPYNGWMSLYFDAATDVMLVLVLMIPL